MKTSRKIKVFLFVFCAWAQCSTIQAQTTRGIGVYPGAAEEFFGPQLVAGDGYRNLAQGRMVYQSSSFDFNMTAQLLTDGIIQGVKELGSKGVKKTDPVFLEVSTPDGQLPQRQRESTIDGNDWTTSYVMGDDTWLQYAWHGMAVEADKIGLIGTVAYRETDATDGYRIRVVVSNDGKRWQQVATVKGDTLPGLRSRSMVNSDPNKNAGNDEMLPTRRLNIDLPFSKALKFNYLRVELQMKGAAYWAFTENPITLSGRSANVLPSSGFTSAWMVQSDRDEWACIDLGAKSEIGEIKLHWIEKPKKFEVQVSEDGKNFTQFTIHNSQFTNKNRLADQSTFKIQNSKQTARFVRVYIPKGEKPQRVILSEVEVMGRGGLVAKPHAEVGWNHHPQKFFLDGGDWRLQRASEVSATGENISKQGFDASSWTVATVPATVLMSYVNAGALPNPNYDDNLLGISESFFNSNFWYRREFRVPQEMRGQRVFLNFDGINWKADIWLNGRKIDRLEGAFLRGKTDVTRYLNDGVNVLAVEIERCANPGGAKLKNEQTTDFNGGVLGADNPTFHATVGWDWISTIRGRDIGIWNDVYLTSTANDVTLSDPLVSSRVAINDGGDTLATMQPCVILKNYAETPITGTLKGWIGDIKFEKTVALAGGEERQIDFHPADFPQLRDQKMKLWWPNGYGEPHLYNAGFSFSTASNPNHSQKEKTVNSQLSTVNYKVGIREMTYAEVDTRLQIFVNGQRFVPLGGNWGFSENNLCYRGREYDAAVRYHREMNLNCIRNWVGQIGDREFYEACDHHGIMVWQDFWLANPVDGPNPDDNEMFLKNARDYVLRIRQHPSIMLYCGRNEGYPPKAIDDGLRQLVSELNGEKIIAQQPSPMLYISSSADDGVSGHGPYWAIPAKEYFEKQTGKLHTERGMPNMMTYEGLSRTLRPEHLWPQNEFWGQHDFTQQGAQRGASFNALISKGFGQPKDAREFTTLAQWQNYDGYRAMYESTNHDRQGLLIWMSHPTWPSMVWQTYDYYFEPTAAYFGTKKACEPLHVQWNALTDSVEIVNRTASEQKFLTVEARLFDKNGRELACEDCVIDVKFDETRPAMPIPSLSRLLSTEKVGFLRLRMTNSNAELLSENTYICAAETGNYQALKELPQAELNIEKSTLRHTENGTVSCTVTLENRGRVPAVMLRLNLKAADGDQILPVIYSDNYFHLLPNEKRSICISWNRRDARDLQPVVEVSGYNVSLSNNRIE